MPGPGMGGPGMGGPGMGHPGHRPPPPPRRYRRGCMPGCLVYVLGAIAAVAAFVCAIAAIF